MRRADPSDAPAIAAFLGARAESSMFPLANLVRHGMAGGHPRAMRFWVAGTPPTDVLGVTGEGMILPQITLAAVPAAARALGGLAIMGLAGEAAQVRALMAAAGLDRAPVQMSHDEPHFALALDRLVMPDCAGLRLAPLSAVDRGLLLDWRTGYEIEALGATPEQAPLTAAADIDAWLAADSHRVLLRDRKPVAMTGFNARLPGIVQVGGVWTPPALRGQGLARAAVALHLAEARAAGATRATLFAASDMAARAYRAIGFGQIGRFALTLFRDRPVVP